MCKGVYLSACHIEWPLQYAFSFIQRMLSLRILMFTPGVYHGFSDFQNLVEHVIVLQTQYARLSWSSTSAWAVFLSPPSLPFHVCEIQPLIGMATKRASIEDPARADVGKSWAEGTDRAFYTTTLARCHNPFPPHCLGCLGTSPPSLN